ncbi:MAG: HAD-IIIA family hydrolase [Pseudomonadales bacterium]|jgi:3-deoxy-D-manno-octulosonate 8-phosphate phosphatase (KDO 8-P phosphatase)|nr:HAD-IIIA family hydrolase [Pseudomonadales bacterium]MDP6470849.1 HAD-IIIA family hydrolase [Pseudomonadales bacterium]MDP6825966.1 HAD-IIIA family hydrolase [Pseudomonadales bacterium]MDP6972278.1 HAD-IIIA family hydrolase [Pseudomonadales bacterium]
MTTPPTVLDDAGIRQKAAAIRLVVFDVDGVLTDGRITYTSDGQEIKSFNVQDGAALKLLMSAGIEVAIITGRSSEMVQRRARELGIAHLYQGSEDKITSFQTLLAQLDLAPSQSAHVGDDLPDLALFDLVSMSVSVPNGHPVVREAADWVTQTAGGQGVAREVCEIVLRAQDKWPYG